MNKVELKSESINYIKLNKNVLYKLIKDNYTLRQNAINICIILFVDIYTHLGLYLHNVCLIYALNYLRILNCFVCIIILLRHLIYIITYINISFKYLIKQIFNLHLINKLNIFEKFYYTGTHIWV